jgi:hypothetical protein
MSNALRLDKPFEAKSLLPRHTIRQSATLAQNPVSELT